MFEAVWFAWGAVASPGTRRPGKRPVSVSCPQPRGCATRLWPRWSWAAGIAVGDGGDFAVEIVAVVAAVGLLVVGFGGPVAADVSGAEGEVGRGELEGGGAAEGLLGDAVDSEGLGTGAGSEDGVVPGAVIDLSGGDGGGGGAVPPFAVEFAVVADVQDRVVLAGQGAGWRARFSGWRQGCRRWCWWS